MRQLIHLYLAIHMHEEKFHLYFLGARFILLLKVV